MGMVGRIIRGSRCVRSWLGGGFSSPRPEGDGNLAQRELPGDGKVSASELLLHGASVSALLVLLDDANDPLWEDVALVRPPEKPFALPHLEYAGRLRQDPRIWDTSGVGFWGHVGR
eukprot:CAMPEP_0184714602 /NCGR_PEP_ID=MMETSP0314-20130426/4697_1 /TAXON_ID=38298 /ORGANISM="Rhodella maculata, Strain CCMP 736" /LENGTH=115 /DNA_ID=CAMNT_0027177553 /DNA_START=1875 /DNA_END=2219 /DNA_ORIENTATION=+